MYLMTTGFIGPMCVLFYVFYSLLRAFEYYRTNSKYILHYITVLKL